MVAFTCFQHGRSNDEDDGDRDEVSMITGTKTVANIIYFREDFNLAVSGTWYLLRESAGWVEWWINEWEGLRPFVIISSALYCFVAELISVISHQDVWEWGRLSKYWQYRPRAINFKLLMSFGFSISPPVFSGSLAPEHISGLEFDPRQRFQGCCDALSSKPKATVSNIAMPMTYLLPLSAKSLPGLSF